MRFHPRIAVFGVFCFIAFSIESWAAAPAMRTLDARRHHLRAGTNAEWEEFAASQPSARRLDLTFDATTNAAEQTLLLWQDDVKLDWRIDLNGKRIGSLFLMESPLNFALRLPGGSLRQGSNTLSIIPPRENDDIRVGEIRLAPQPLESALGECT